MLPVIEASFQPVNLPFTLLLLAVAGYWLLVIVGGLTSEFLDFDFADGDADGVAEGLGGKLAGFFHLGDVPLMVVVTFFVTSMWAVSIVSNYYLNPNLSALVSLWWLGPNVVLSLLLAKGLLLLLAPLMRKGKASAARMEMIGRTAVVTTSEVSERFGQVRIDHQGPPIVLNARVAMPPYFQRGDLVRIIGYNPHDDTYLIEAGKPDKELTL